MVGFRHLVGTGIAPVSKKTVKIFVREIIETSFEFLIKISQTLNTEDCLWLDSKKEDLINIFINT
jgi:hypothetical protein